jgi:hypothetical protein
LKVLAAPRAPLEGEQSCQAATGDTAGDIGVIEPSVFDAESVAVPTDSPRAPLEPREEILKQLHVLLAEAVRCLDDGRPEVTVRKLAYADSLVGDLAAARPRPALPRSCQCEYGASGAHQAGCPEAARPALPQEPTTIDIEAMRANLHATFNGGWGGVEALRAFHHGMDTVCNVLAAKQDGKGTNGIFPEAARPALGPQEEP